MENDFSDTLGAGSYPEPPKTGVKEYTFRFNCNCIASTSIQAKDYEEAEEELRSRFLLGTDYDIVFEDLDVEDILNYEVEDLD